MTLSTIEQETFYSKANWSLAPRARGKLRGLTHTFSGVALEKLWEKRSPLASPGEEEEGLANRWEKLCCVALFLLKLIYVNYFKS